MAGTDVLVRISSSAICPALFAYLQHKRRYLGTAGAPQLAPRTDHVKGLRQQSGSNRRNYTAAEAANRCRGVRQLHVRLRAKLRAVGVATNNRNAWVHYWVTRQKARACCLLSADYHDPNSSWGGVYNNSPSQYVGCHLNLSLLRWCTFGATLIETLRIKSNQTLGE